MTAHRRKMRLQLSRNRSVTQNNLHKIKGLNTFSVFIDTHIAAGDLINQDDLSVMHAKLKFDVVKLAIKLCKFTFYQFADVLRLRLQVLVLLLCKNVQEDKCVFRNGRVLPRIVF